MMRTINLPTSDEHRVARRKQTGRSLARVLGDALLSLAVHAVVVILLLRLMVSPPPSDASRQIEVTMEDPEPLQELDRTQDLNEAPPEDDPTELVAPDWAEVKVEEAVVETPSAAADEVLSIESRLIMPMLVDNSVSTRQLQRGKGTQFGYGDKLKGDLVGTMYDLKRDRKGSARVCDYAQDLQHMLEGRLAPEAFRDFYAVPKPLYLAHLLVPKAEAESGPAAFGVGELMESRNWVVHYTGQMQTTRAGRYRFVGMFDDLLMVLVDGQIVHEFLWTGDPSPWEPKDHVGKHPCFAGQPLVYGDWFELNSMQKRRVDVLVGEHPGGRVGGVLLIQREGEEYAMEPNGRPILPIFALQPLTPDDEAMLASFAEMKFAPQVPVMGARSEWKAPAARSAKDEIAITIQ